MTNRLLVWGASGHALVVADIARLAGYEVVGFLNDLAPAQAGRTFDGCPVYGEGRPLESLRESVAGAIAIGIGNNAARTRLANRAVAAGFSLPALVHPRAVVARSVTLSVGTVVVAGAVLNPGVRVGELCVVNTAASVDHECVIEDGVMVGPGSRLAGNVAVGAGAWVGIGAVVLQKCRIGAGSVIGAGAVVVRDVPPNVVAYGIPARIVREVNNDD